MTSSFRRQMRELIKELGSDPAVPLDQLEHVHRLRQCHWAGDLKALASLWRDRPGWVERYLDMMVAVMHKFPDRGGAPAEKCPAAALDQDGDRRQRLGLDPQ